MHTISDLMRQSLLGLLEASRRQWHPLHQLRKLSLFRRVSTTIDFPVWRRLYGIRHPVRLRLMRNLSYLVNARTTEPEMVALFLAINKMFSPSTFWDIGANIGYYSWLLKSQNTSMAVSLFEPDPINLDLLHQTALGAGGGGSGIAIVPYAASDADGEAVFVVDPVSGATGTLKNTEQEFTVRHYGVSPETIPVKTVALDTFRRNTLPPELIKIDVEGHESAVIRGAQRTLGEDQPILIFESFARDAALFAILHGLEYQLFDAERMTGDLQKTTNFLALPARHVSRFQELEAAWRQELDILGLSSLANAV
ncbi:MAG: hypothetical protein C0401_07310 [Anaerolinea sp.]|nr:hypothetical protein [Anaerolinea sp.]